MPKPCVMPTAIATIGAIAGTERIAAAGIPKAKARDLTIQLIMLLEGAFLLCRASKTTEAMKIAGDASVASIRAALPKRSSARRAR